MEMKSRRKSWGLQSCKSAGQGRDELNLAEFPIAAVASRLPKGQKTLTFEDRIWDSSQNRTVLRRLTISASDKYGLPTAKDDEVILGLIQITREADFQSRQVFFSRYQVTNSSDASRDTIDRVSSSQFTEKSGGFCDP